MLNIFKRKQNQKNLVKIYMIAFNLQLFSDRKEDLYWFAKHTCCAGMKIGKTKMYFGYLTTELQLEAFNLAKERYGNKVSFVSEIGLVENDKVDYANAQA